MQSSLYMFKPTPPGGVVNVAPDEVASSVYLLSLLLWTCQLEQTLRALASFRYGSYGLPLVPLVLCSCSFLRLIKQYLSSTGQTYSLLDKAPPNRSTKTLSDYDSCEPIAETNRTDTKGPFISYTNDSFTLDLGRNHQHRRSFGRLSRCSSLLRSLLRRSSHHASAEHVATCYIAAPSDIPSRRRLSEQF